MLKLVREDENIERYSDLTPNEVKKIFQRDDLKQLISSKIGVEIGDIKLKYSSHESGDHVGGDLYREVDITGKSDDLSSNIGILSNIGVVKQAYISLHGNVWSNTISVNASIVVLYDALKPSKIEVPVLNARYSDETGWKER